MPIPSSYQSLKGYNVVYSDSELRQAIANVEVQAQGNSGGSGGGGTTPAVRTARLISATSGGTVSGGKISVAIANTGTSNGTVDGTTLPPGASISWQAQGSDTINAINYDATNTTFLISTLA